MARRTVVLLAVLALSIVSCGGNTEKSAVTTTTTTESSATTAPIKYASPAAIKRIALQVDDALRRDVVTADACIHGDLKFCSGRARDAFQQIDELVGAVSIMQETVTKGSRLYAGDLPDAIAGLFTQTIDAGSTAKAASLTAQQECASSQTAKCKAAQSSLDDALIVLYKQFNQWRHLAA